MIGRLAYPAGGRKVTRLYNLDLIEVQVGLNHVCTASSYSLLRSNSFRPVS